MEEIIKSLKESQEKYLAGEGNGWRLENWNRNNKENTKTKGIL